MKCEERFFHLTKVVHYSFEDISFKAWVRRLLQIWTAGPYKEQKNENKKEQKRERTLTFSYQADQSFLIQPIKMDL